jgi:queuine tRNA-ribosyltransferase
VEHTVEWAKTSRRTLDELADRTGERRPLFAVVQGGGDRDLRRECASRLAEIGFDGYGFGGWPVAEDGRLVDEVASVAEFTPADVPLWGLGIGKPENIAKAYALGYRLFDCVLPTRDGRRGRLYVRGGNEDTGYSYVYINDRKHVRADRPLDESCDCPCCERYSRAYLHHLFAVRDVLALRLATIHNLRHYTRLMAELRARDKGPPGASGDAQSGH